MASPSFSRYAALLAGVLDGSPADGGCADAAPGDAGDAGDAEAMDAGALDRVTRRAACALRRPSASPPRARPSSLDAYRGLPAAAPATDARLDRRG